MTTTASVTEILQRLIGFDTTSRLSNLELIAWVEAQLSPVAASMVRLPNTAGDKSNLWVRLGPDAPGGIVLSGHTDVVPVDDQDWLTDPFQLTRQGDALIGRGTSDMKSFLALCIAFAPRLASAAKTRPVHFAFSYDEEIGCSGSPPMVEAIAAASHPPALCWVGEPTLWGVVSGHKSISTYQVEVRGMEAHSSLPHLGASAIHAAVRLMSMLQDIAADLEANPPPGSEFDPPYATLTIGQVSGGTATNILAGHCRFAFDLRCPPGLDAETVLAPFMAAAQDLDAELKTRAAHCSVSVDRHSSTVSLRPDRDSAAEAFVRAITGDNAFRTAGYAAEAGQFQAAGIPTVICGPGNIEQAHQPNEWIKTSQIDRGIDVFSRLVDQIGAV